MSNEEMRARWSQEGAGWVAHEEIFDHAFAPVTAALQEAVAVTPGLRALDVGCGSGTVLAHLVAEQARAVGVDISETMARGAQDRCPEATVVVADAQTDDLLAIAPGDPFDLVLSRFGVMFFADPVAAFTNIAAATRPGGRLAFTCWRTRAENPIFTHGNELIVDRLDAPATDPDAPGPTAFARPERIEEILGAAGWTGVSIDPLDFVCDFSVAGSDGVEERLALVLSSSTWARAREQLRPGLGEDGWDALIEQVREDLRARRVDGSVRLPGACWLVTAQRG